MGAQRRSMAEVNFSRLARRMEEMARDREAAGWRFGRYLQDLRGRLGDLKRLEGPLRPDDGRLKFYEERVAMLQSMLTAEQRAATVQEKADLLGAIAPPAAVATSAAASSVAAATATAAAPANSVAGRGGGRDESNARDVQFSREVLSLAKAHVQAENRRELLSFSNPDDDTAPDDAGTRRRPAAAANAPDEQALQDSVTENMLQLARALKQSAKISGDTVRSDLTKIRQLSDLSDSNYGRLKLESDRLDQQLGQQCNWLLWFMVALVAVTFVGMVMFMRFFSKKIYKPV